MGSGCSSSSKDKKVDEQVIIDEHDYLVGPEAEFRSSEKADFFKQVKIKDNFSVLVAGVNLDDAPNGDVKFVAIGAKCTHYGADLGKGVMRDGKIYCPWHGACFDFETGDIEDFPGLDNVPSYRCKVKDQKVFVRVEPDRIQNKVMRPLGKRRNDSVVFAIIGSGAAGYMCAQTLRQEGFDGRLLMITADKELPYDRPKLSKAPGSSWDDIKLRGRNFYADNDIDVFLDSPVEMINANHKRIRVKGKEETMPYDSLFIAVGNSPRKYKNVPGVNLKNIVTLHNFHDSQWIAQNAAGKRLLISGASFIAMELASSLKDKCESITIIARSETPFLHVFGSAVGKRLLEHLLTHGPAITFLAPDEIVEFKGDADGAVCGARTLKKHIECDLVVLALGGVVDTSWNDMERIKVHSTNKTIKVDEYLETNVPCVFAGGDCVNFPIDIGAKTNVNIGHWQVALTHGRVAALNMLGHRVSVSSIIPFFWTNVCGVNIRYCGYGESFDEVLIFGSLEKMECCVIYRRSKRMLAALGIGCDPLITELSVELQKEAEWHKNVEFSPCLVNRFPDPPEIVDDEAAISQFTSDPKGLLMDVALDRPIIRHEKEYRDWAASIHRVYEQIDKLRARWVYTRPKPPLGFIALDKEMRKEKKRRHQKLKLVKREKAIADIEAKLKKFKHVLHWEAKEDEIIPKPPIPVSASSSPQSGRSDMYYSSNSIITSTSTESIPTDKDELDFAELPREFAARLKYSALADAKKWLDPDFNTNRSLFGMARRHHRHVIKIYKMLYPPSDYRRTPEARYLRVERRRRRECRQRDAHEQRQRRRQVRLQRLPHNLL